jgi:hypothetical protein
MMIANTVFNNASLSLNHFKAEFKMIAKILYGANQGSEGDI